MAYTIIDRRASALGGQSKDRSAIGNHNDRMALHRSIAQKQSVYHQS
jgi:hypothetical protein